MGTRRHSPGGTDVKGADTNTKSHKSPNSLIQPPICSCFFSIGPEFSYPCRQSTRAFFFWRLRPRRPCAKPEAPGSTMDRRWPRRLVAFLCIANGKHALKTLDCDGRQIRIVWLASLQPAYNQQESESSREVTHAGLESFGGRVAGGDEGGWRGGRPKMELLPPTSSSTRGSGRTFQKNKNMTTLWRNS